MSRAGCSRFQAYLLIVERPFCTEIREYYMLKQVWEDVATELPPDRWIGKIRVRFPVEGVLEKDCLGFQRKNAITGAENDFTYQHGTVDGQTGKWRTPPGTVTHWLKIVEIAE